MAEQDLIKVARGLVDAFNRSDLLSFMHQHGALPA
jgi:hypothetical protein